MKNLPYFRLVTNKVDPDSHLCQGIFQPAYSLLDESSALDVTLERRIRTLLCWFEAHVPNPPKDRLHPRAVFWFKGHLAELSRNAWQIAVLLNECGLEVTFVKTLKPGYIVYEDDYQVAAIPFRDSILKHKG